MPESRVLLAGFESFGPYRHNVAETLISKLDGQIIEARESARLRIVGLKLPINFGSFREVLSQAIHSTRPRIAMGLGMDFKDLDHLSFELSAHRDPTYGTDIRDMKGQVGQNDSLDDLPEIISVPGRKELGDVISDIEGIETSENAGRHMCETVLRDLIRMSDAGKEFQPGFIHLPHTPDLLVDSEKLEKHEKSMLLEQQDAIIRSVILAVSDLHL